MIEYLIASDPRSGGNMLCDILRNAGIGVPDEYLERHIIAALMQEWDIESAEYAAELRTRAALGGIYGIKVSRYQLGETLVVSDPIQLFESTPKVIRLTRSDALLQAVSRSIAEQTQIWQRRCEEEDRSRVRYSRSLIEWALFQNILANKYWEVWFAQHDIVPLRLFYEELCANRQAAFDKIMKHLGMPLMECPAPTLVKQADDTNRDFYRRYIDGEMGIAL